MPDYYIDSHYSCLSRSKIHAELGQIGKCASAKALTPISRSIQLDPDCSFPAEAVFNTDCV